MNLPLPDRAGRGALFAEIKSLAEAAFKASPHGTAPDRDECARLLARLDKARQKACKMYPKVNHANYE